MKEPIQTSDSLSKFKPICIHYGEPKTTLYENRGRYAVEQLDNATQTIEYFSDFDLAFNKFLQISNK